jgi:hypothetical protein
LRGAATASDGEQSINASDKGEAARFAGLATNTSQRTYMELLALASVVADYCLYPFRDYI